MIDRSVFDTMNKHEVVQLSPVNAGYELADGTELVVLGEFNTEIQIAGKWFSQAVIVADLGGLAGILGLDFMEAHDVVLKLSKGQFIMGNTTSQMHREEANHGCCRIRMGESFSVPARSVVVIWGRIDRKSLAKVKTVPNLGAVDGLSSLAEATGLVMGRGLAKCENGRLPINLVNVHDKPIRLEKGRTLGLFQPVTSVAAFDLKCCNVQKILKPELLDETDLPEHVRSMIEGNTELTVEQRSEVIRIMLENIDVFVSPDGKLGNTDVVKHTIDTGDHAPIKLPARRLPWAKQEAADAEVEKMLKRGIIEPSDSPWAAPTVLVTKKDGTIRFCIDYRKLNDITRKEAYPLPRIDDSLDTLGGAEWFCTMDLARGFWQVNMDEKDKSKTAVYSEGIVSI